MSSTQHTAVPLPPEVSITVDPLLELLTAFPVPQLLTTSTLLLRDGTACSRKGVSDERVEKSVLESARTLMASNSYIALCRAADDAGGSVANNSSSSGSSGSNGGSVPQLSPLAQRIHEELLQMEEDRLHSISGAKTVSTPPKHERWMRSTESRMALRPRSAAQAVETGLPIHEVKKPGPVLQVVLQDTELSTAQSKMEPYCEIPMSAIIKEGLSDTDSVNRFLGMLAGTAQPFRGIQADRLTAFVSALAEPPAAETAELPAAVMERAVACCACVSHPSFEPSILPEDIVDHLITILAAVVRRVSKRLAGHGTATAAAVTINNNNVSSNADLECLRAMLRCFAILVCDTRLSVCAHGDLLRLEDLCFQCLFVVAKGFGRQEVTDYAAYVISHAVHLYRCLWNRLELERDATLERFFPRLPHGDHLLLRLYLLPSGVKTMTLTAAVVAAAQSTPACAGSVTRGAAERLQQQCSVWATLFLQHFALEEREEKKERDMCCTVVLQLCEDLSHMIGLPEYPAADLLLRSLLVSFVQCFSRMSSMEGLRPLFVDAVFRVSYVLFGAAQQNLQRSTLPASCVLNAAQLQQWRQLTSTDTGAATEGRREQEQEQLHTEEIRRAVLYMALSRCVADPARDAAAASFHTRAAHIFTWALQDDCLHEAALDPLVRTMHAADGGVSLGWDVLHACSAQLCASCDKSLLSPMAKERLPAWLLSVFQAREEQQHTAGLDVARKKAIGHVAKLTALHPPLLERIWPIVRRCVRDDNARVREAIIPLLLTLLSETCRSHGLTTRVNETAADVVSSLLHLLSDRSVVVVTRAIAALDTLLTDALFRPLLETTPAGEHLLTFTQSKLLPIMSPAKESRHQTDVMRLFLRRWAGQEPTDIAAHHAHTRVARELMRLTLSSMAYPYEVNESMHLVVLLRGMCRVATAATAHATAKRTSRQAEADSQELSGVMMGAAKVLWAEQQRLTPAPEAASALAAIHALTMACSEWVEPLLEVLAQALAQQQQPTASVSDKEATGVTLLHVCRILRTVLLAPRPPPLSLHPLVRALTALLSRYVGPHQHHILLSASGVLVATITCGTDRLSKNANSKYLMLCYSLMNTYYVRTLGLVASLRTDPQSIAYTLRFLFLLSEFLRLYPGWKHEHPGLTEDAAVAGGAGVPNQLACGDGICANVYAAAEKVLQQCPEEARKRTAVIVLRVLASLCMLQPTVFFHRCEPHLHRALDPAGDVSMQTQGLVLIRDFLMDEDARVDYAAAMNAPVPLPSTVAAPSSSPSKRKRRRHEELHVDIAPCVDEQNSGMATWVMQQFHGEVLRLCESSSLPVRQLALEVMQLCTQGGLLPPSRYAGTLTALAADPQSEVVRLAAIECVAVLSERYADVVSASAATGIVKAFDLHDACGVDVLRSALLADAGPQAVECVHAHLFAALRKRHRDVLISSLLRYFYQEGRAAQWLQDHQHHHHHHDTEYGDEDSHHNSSISNRSSAGEMARNPFPFLGHLTIVVAYIPYTLESDVLYVLESCRAAIDLVGQSCLDFVEAQLALLQPKKRQTRSSTSSNKRRSSGGETAVPVLVGKDIDKELWKCFGALCIAQLRGFLHSEYGLHGARLRRITMRRGASSHNTTNAARREPQSAASSSFQQKIAALVESMTPLWGTSAETVSRHRALDELHAALSKLLQEVEEERDALIGGGGSAQRKRGSRGSPATVPEKRRRQQRRREVMEASSSSSSSSSSSDSGSSGNSEHSGGTCSNDAGDAESSDTE